MCGIFGKLYFKTKTNEKKILLNCLNRLDHRGPDDTGIFEDKNVFLGSKRLAIIDRSSEGRMPLSNEDETLWIAFNGEIYNHIELKACIRKKHNFKSRTDTEVLLHLYEEIGSECLHHIRGMFAFAIWNTKKKELFIARDRLGKKPLSFYMSDKAFIFGSELQALMADPSIPRSVNNQSVSQYFSLGYIPSPNTYYKQVYKLEPATFMIINSERMVRKERYWQQLFLPKHDLSFQDTGQILLEKLKESVKIRLRSDLPVGIHLSGGIDSSLITAIASQEITYPLETYSVGFEDEGYDELPYARMVSNRYKTSHHEITVRPQIINELPQIVSSFGEPFSDPAILPTWALCRATKKKTTVILNGDGGDENFGGYKRYRTNMLKHYLEKIPCKKQLKYLLSIGKNETLAKIGTLLENSSLPPLDFYLSQLAEITRKQIDMYTYFSDKWDEALGPLDRLLHFDFKTILPECYMVKTDIMSMHFGLETRSPFLDHEVVEFVSRLPERYKASLFEDKIILKSIATNLLPKECISRKKQGFNVPLYSWFKKNKRFLIDAFETDSNLYTFVSKKEVMKLTNDFYDSPEMGHRTYKLWSLLVFHLWSLSTKQ